MGVPKSVVDTPPTNPLIVVFNNTVLSEVTFKPPGLNSMVAALGIAPVTLKMASL